MPPPAPATPLVDEVAVAQAAGAVSGADSVAGDITGPVPPAPASSPKSGSHKATSGEEGGGEDEGDESQAAVIGSRPLPQPQLRGAGGAGAGHVSMSAEAASAGDSSCTAIVPVGAGVLAPRSKAASRKSLKPEGGYEGKCWFECGQCTGLTNIGNSRSVKLACGPCQASRRAFDLQAKELGQAAKDEVNDLKKNRQAEYKEMVRRARLFSGRGSRADMAQAVNSYINELMVAKSVTETVEIYWMNKDEFIGHQITVLGHSRADGEATWNRELRNSQRAKRGTGTDLRLAVQGIPKTVASSGVTMNRSLSQSSVLDFSGKDGEARLAQVSETLAPAALPDLGSSEVFSAMDRTALGFGAASSSSGQSNPLAHLSAGSGGRTGVAELASTPAPLLALQAASVAETPSRTSRRLKGHASDPRAAPISKADEAKSTRSSTELNDIFILFVKMDFFRSHPVALEAMPH